MLYIGRKCRYYKGNAEALVVVSNDTGLEVNADKTEYMVTSRDQIAGLSHSIKIDNSSFERVEEFKYLGKALTHQNTIKEDVKNRLKSGNVCYHSVLNCLYSSLPSKNLKNKMGNYNFACCFVWV
jgi:hypothetical protein